jgi:hypothetical protein
MGDRRKRALRAQFDGKLRLTFHGAKITSGAGLPPFRELDEAFPLTEKGSIALSDPRHGKNTQHTMLAMLRQAVFGPLAGYEDVNNAERLRGDPGPYPAVRRSAAVGAAWVTLVTKGNVGDARGPGGRCAETRLTR